MFRLLPSRVFVKLSKLEARRSLAVFNSEGFVQPKGNKPEADTVAQKLAQTQSGLLGLNGFAATRKKSAVKTLVPVAERNYREDVLRFKKQMIRAMQPMIQHNSFIDFYTQEQDGCDWLSISTPKGKFHFFYQPTENIMTFISYDSGYHGYRYYPEDNVWLSKKDDQHNMLGMITRDMIHHLGGCPDFNYADLTEPGYTLRHGNNVIDEEKIANHAVMLQLEE